MKNTVHYEWIVETHDEHGDIIDTCAYDSLKDLTLSDNEVLVLVRNEGNESKGLQDRLWAYVSGNEISEYFVDSEGVETDIRVPEKPRAELNKYMALKLKATETIHFKKGVSYPIEHTQGYPPKYFRKPKYRKEDPARPDRFKEGETDDMSDYDVCVKTFKIIQKWYE